MRISVAIITKDRLKLLALCLKSLERQSQAPDEVIIVDNGSVEKAIDLCKSFSKALPIKYIYEQKPSQPKARNIALNVSNYEIVAFIDDDCEADENWIDTIKKNFEKHSDSVAIQGNIDSRQNNLIAQTSIFQRLNNANLGYLDTANLALNKTFLNKLSIRFDESLLSAYDKDITMKIVSKNGEINFADDAIVYHNFTNPSFKALYRYFFYGYWNFKFKKSFPKKGMRFSNAINFVSLLNKSKISIITKAEIIFLYFVYSFISLLGYLAAFFTLRG